MSSLDIVGQLEASFNTRPVDIIEFAESKKFCGRTLYPRQRLLLKLIFLQDLTPAEDKILDYWIAGGRNGTEIEISPDIRERIKYLKASGYKHFRELVFVGGRRCSKGYLTGLCLSKLVYDTIQLQDPNRAYKIDADKEIIYSVIAAAQDQAKDQQYADFASMVNSCQALGRHIYKMQELEFSLMTEEDIRKISSWKRAGRKVQRDISKIRGKALPANSRTIRGSATMALCFDEFAHFMQGESDQSDAEVYAAAIPALAQFGRDGMIFCNSSPYSKVGKFFQRFDEGMKLDEDTGEAVNPTMFSIRLPSWALYEGWWEDPEFVANPDAPKKCLLASPDWNPDRRKPDGSHFYTEDDRHLIDEARHIEASDPVKFKVEWRGHFAEVVDAYLDPVMVDRMFKGRPIEVHEMDGSHLEYHAFDTNWDQATYQHEYKGHIDPSSTTAGFGFALGHTEIYKIGERVEDHVVFDIIRRWDPKDFPDNVIDWEPILEELLHYCEIFHPKSLTFDQHQNQMPMQWLGKQCRSRGIATRVFEKTADIRRNWFRAEVFRTSLYRNLVHGPDINLSADAHHASLELKYLQEIRTGSVPRVEKQDVGPIQTKDVADCVMEVTEALLGVGFQREELGEMQMRMGAPGGFSLANPERATLQELSSFYSRTRQGEQGFGRGMGRDQSVNPARRVAGGRPVPRALPRRRLPGY